MASASSSPFQNIYYERKVATARPCYICRLPTQTVLSTLKTEDYLYICEKHLTDPGFAAPIAAPPVVAPGPTPQEIRKVIADYQAREAKKSEISAGDKEKDKDSKDTDKADIAKPPKAPESPAPSIPAAPTQPGATHRKFALHRQIFGMRYGELKRKEQGAKANEAARGELALLIRPF